MNWKGSIEEVLRSGEYDQGDIVTIDYDELADLAEQGRLFAEAVKVFCPPGVIEMIEKDTNRPLHPVLGGKSPYSEFLPLG